METKDRYYYVLIILIVNGIGTLLPWNMFITANDFFVNHKFNSTEVGQSGHIYQNNYHAFVGISSKVPNTILQALNFLHPSKSYSLFLRINISLIIEIVIFAFIIILAIIDTSKWIDIYFALTMISIVIINMANGIYQNSLYGIVANLPTRYTNMIITGTTISGTYSSIVLIFSIIITPNPQLSAIFYFSTAVIFLIVCLLTINSLPSNKFYCFHQNEEQIKDELKLNKKANHLSDLNLAWSKIRFQCINLFMIQFVTLSCFPAIVANTQPCNNLVDEQYFIPIFCFLSFNVFSIVGTLLTEVLTETENIYLYILIYIRTFFIPYFLFCNYNLDDRRWAVYLDSDYYLIFGVVSFAMTHGYCLSMQMVHIPSRVEFRHATKASMIASFFAILGVLGGVSFSPIFTWFIT